MVEFIIKSCYSIFRIRVGGMYMKKCYKAIDFANWFLWYNEVQRMQQITDSYDVYEGLTHLKIQKLLYYAEGINLAINETDLFKEKIYAWPHGPVIREVYEILSKNGSNEIPFEKKQWDIVKEINENPDLYNTLVTTYENYAGYTAWQLREKSHVVGGPWQVTVDIKGMQKEIDKDLIKDYFRKNIVRTDAKE